MIRALALAVLAALGLTVLSGAVYGGHAAWLTAVTLAPIGAAAVLVAHVVTTQRARLGGLRAQAVAVGALIAVATGAAVALFVGVMFVSPHDAFFLAVLTAYAALVGVLCASALGSGALADLDAVRGTLHAVAAGRRDVRTGVAGGGEIAELAAEVDAMVARLDGEEQARRALVAAVSHDLRTPITALRLLADAVEDGIVDAETSREYAARMGLHVQALGALIDDLFELTRLESGELRWSMEQVALDELVGEAVEAMRPAAEASSVAVRAVLEAGDPLALGDAARLQRVLFNLIQNAIRHTPPDGTVIVRTSRGDGGAVEIEVADSGAGIPAAERERVFEAFHRLDRSRTDDGAGLGLAISRAIVEAHGGRIWIADAERGTSVRVRLAAG
ncbi:sensor histidine kinase [Conexibacter woesei]|uniref:sensor histidine kinase n=1 Tax=Conexibacter woesei TaxID=191495 RepID=UPI000429CC3D|nr:HAMP domain-containing sensor histidine kinase [Conexibacter woesei]